MAQPLIPPNPADSGGPLARADNAPLPPAGGPPGVGAPAPSPLGAASGMGMPPAGGVIIPWGTGEGTMLNQEDLLRLMGALDDPEARRHKFIGGLLQGTRSGSSGESFGNAFNALGDYEMMQMHLRAQYLPFMLNSIGMYNTQVREWDKYRYEQTGKWNDVLRSEVAALGPMASDTDVIGQVTARARAMGMPEPIATNFLSNYFMRRAEGVNPGTIADQYGLAAAGAAKAYEEFHPTPVEVKVPVPGGTASAFVVAPRAGTPGIPPVSVAGMVGPGAVQPTIEKGADGSPWVHVPGLGPLNLTDPKAQQAYFQWLLSQPKVTLPQTPAPAPTPAPGRPPIAPAPEAPSLPGMPGPGAGAVPSPVTPPAAPLARPMPPTTALPTPGLPGARPGPAAPAGAPKATPDIDAPPAEYHLPPIQPWTAKTDIDQRSKMYDDFGKERMGLAKVVQEEQVVQNQFNMINSIMQTFQPGKTAPLRADAALWLKDFAVWTKMFTPDQAQKMVTGIAGGDPSSYQFAEKLLFPMALHAVRSALEGASGSRIGQMESLRMALSQPNMTMDPSTLASIIELNMRDWMRNTAELNAMNRWDQEYQKPGHTVNLSAFPQWWNLQVQSPQRNLVPPLAPMGGAFTTPYNIPGIPSSIPMRVNPATGKIEGLKDYNKDGTPNWREMWLKGLPKPAEAFGQ